MAEPTDLNTLNRADLNAYATEKGVQGPETYATKAELIAAIEAAEAGTGAEQPPEGEAAPESEPPPGEEFPPEGEAPPDGEEAPPVQADYAPIEADDDTENPVFVEVPKTDEEVAEEGNRLAAAESVATGGVVEQAFTSEVKAKNKRKWALDAPHNTNDRLGGHGFEKPDFVETVG